MDKNLIYLLLYVTTNEESVDSRTIACVCATMSRVLTIAAAAAVVPFTHYPNSVLPRHVRLSNLPSSLTVTTHTLTFRGRFFSPYSSRAVPGPADAGLTGGFDAIIGDGGSMLQDAGATALVIAGAYALVSTFDFLSERKLIEQVPSLSLLHTHRGTPSYMCVRICMCSRVGYM